MVQPPLLTPAMCKSVTVLATAERNGEISPGIAEAFVDETKRLPLTQISDRVHAIRMVANDVGGLREDQLEARRGNAQRGATCWYDLLSGDGFRRERFLLEVNEGAPSAFLLAMFLRRLNDWVPQVRILWARCSGRSCRSGTAGSVCAAMRARFSMQASKDPASRPIWSVDC